MNNNLQYPVLPLAEVQANDELWGDILQLLQGSLTLTTEKRVWAYNRWNAQFQLIPENINWDMIMVSDTYNLATPTEPTDRIYVEGILNIFKEEYEREAKEKTKAVQDRYGIK